MQSIAGGRNLNTLLLNSCCRGQRGRAVTPGDEKDLAVNAKTQSILTSINHLDFIEFSQYRKSRYEYS